MLNNNNNQAAFDGNLLYASLKTHYLNSPQLSQFQEMIIETLKHDFKINVQSINSVFKQGNRIRISPAVNGAKYS